VDSIDGCKSYVVFKDNYTCYQMIKCLKKKLGILNSFQEVVSHAHTYTFYHITFLQSDHGRKYNGTHFQDFLKEHI
jgi:hypothetical protein